jgi:hypothetical protein
LRLDVVDEIGLVIVDFGGEVEVDFASKSLDEVRKRFEELKEFFSPA